MPLFFAPASHQIAVANRSIGRVWIAADFLGSARNGDGGCAGPTSLSALPVARVAAASPPCAAVKLPGRSREPRPGSEFAASPF